MEVPGLAGPKSPSSRPPTPRGVVAVPGPKSPSQFFHFLEQTIRAEHWVERPEVPGRGTEPQFTACGSPSTFRFSSSRYSFGSQTLFLKKANNS